MPPDHFIDYRNDVFQPFGGIRILGEFHSPLIIFLAREQWREILDSHLNLIFTIHEVSIFVGTTWTIELEWVTQAILSRENIS